MQSAFAKISRVKHRHYLYDKTLGTYHGGMTKTPSDKQVVGTSLAVSVSDVALNYIVGVLTGSQTMFAQALQGMSDLVTAGVIFLGVEQSAKKPDKKHPLGYGREVFFWVLLAGMFMFSGTGFLSFYLGYQQVLNPVELDSIWIAFAMLTFGFSSNLYSFSRSLLRLRRTGKGKAAWKRQLLGSSLVETKATFTLDFLGSTSAFFGLIALGLYVITGDARYDGFGGMLVGLSMMAAAIALIVDVKGLIVGRTATPATQAKIEELAESHKHIRDVLDLRTIFLGSSRMLVLLEVHIDDDLTTDQIEKLLDEIKADIQKQIPSTYHIQIEVETPDSELTSR